MAEGESSHRVTGAVWWAIRWFVLPPVLVYAFVFASGALWGTTIGRGIVLVLLALAAAGFISWAWRIERRRVNRRKRKA